MNPPVRPPTIKHDTRRLRILAAVACLGFVFGAVTGLALVYLTSAAVVGSLYFGALFLSWRFRSYIFYGLGFAVFLAGHRISESIIGSAPWAYLAQWLSIAVLFTSCPALIFHQAIIRLCHSSESDRA